MNNRVVHFEIPCDDPEKSMQFFTEVFGWRFQQFGTEPYWATTTGAEGTPGINGGLMKRMHPGQPIVNSIDVNSIDECINRIQNAGGTIVVPKMPIPTVGWLAYFKDPDGNIHGIYQNDPSASQ
jgi:predicted enzyme related to lactoylglutathione lyase